MNPPRVAESGMTSWECPGCGYENEAFMVEGEALPPELNCPMCGYQSGPVDWAVMLKDDGESTFLEVKVNETNESNSSDCET